MVDRGASGSEPPILFWIVPARVEGAWNWELSAGGAKHGYELLVHQQFQRFEGFVRAGVRRENLEEPSLRGDQISFGFTLTLPGLGATRHQFRGRVDGDHVRGTAVLAPADSKPLEVAWQAQRGDAARWFRPTGTNIK
jgi:hypothetical protein